MSKWSEERSALVCSMWGNGLTMTEIGASMGETRCAIAGQIFRLRHVGTEIAKRHGSLNGSKGGRPRRPKAESNRINGAINGILYRIRHPKKPRVLKVKPLAQVIKTIGIPFLEAGRKQCSYPLWNDSRPPVEERMVCGCQTEGGSFCAAHRALCYTKISPKVFDAITWKVVGYGFNRILTQEAA